MSIDFTEPKSVIYAKLSEVATDYGSEIAIAQNRPERIENLPSITFIIENNVPEHELNGDISNQDITVKIDIWAETSKETGSILKIVVAKMLELKYTMTFNKDLEDPSGISHLTTQFNF